MRSLQALTRVRSASDDASVRSADPATVDRAPAEAEQDQRDRDGDGRVLTERRGQKRSGEQHLAEQDRADAAEAVGQDAEHRREGDTSRRCAG